MIMSKFKEGDTVKILNSNYDRISEGDIEVIDYVHYGANYVLIDGLCFYFNEVEVWHPEFEWGEVVEVRDDKDQNWRKATYIGKCTVGHAVETEDEFVVHFYKCRKPQGVTELTLKQIADEFGVDVKDLRIKDHE